jgi:hypothetical protein
LLLLLNDIGIHHSQALPLKKTLVAKRHRMLIVLEILKAQQRKLFFCDNMLKRDWKLSGSARIMHYIYMKRP